jgi:hypothetical protein
MQNVLHIDLRERALLVIFLMLAQPCASRVLDSRPRLRAGPFFDAAYHSLSPNGSFDAEACAELLCYLVVGQLVAMARSGNWLQTDHLVESARIWMASNGAHCDWLQRARLAQESVELALLFSPEFQDSAALMQLFSDAGRLDYRSLAVQHLHRICVAHLG